MIALFDNASVHSKDVSDWIPGRSKAKKAEIIAWLRTSTNDEVKIWMGRYDGELAKKAAGQPHTLSIFKRDFFYDLANKVKPPPLYSGDVIFAEFKIAVHRTPP